MPPTDAVTVAGVTYNIERDQHDGYPTYCTLTVKEFPGLEGRLGYEEDAEFANPRDWSNVGTMAVSYRGYDLGDGDDCLPGEHDRFTVTCPLCDGDGDSRDRFELQGPRWNVVGAGSLAAMEAFDELAYGASGRIKAAACPRCEGMGEVVVDPATYFRERHGARVVIPLFVLDHSGITIRGGKPAVSRPLGHEDVRSTGRFVSDGAGWDTSFVGFTFDTPKGVHDCMGDDATDEQIIAALESEIEDYASYLEGDVTYYRVSDPETGYRDDCGGFVGAHGKHTEEECVSSMGTAIEKRLAELAERAEWAARDVVTV